MMLLKRITPRSWLMRIEKSWTRHPNRAQIRELEVLQEERKVKNRICYGAIMDVCYKNANAKRIAKRCKTKVAKALIEMLRKRF